MHSLHPYLSAVVTCVASAAFAMLLAGCGGEQTVDAAGEGRLRYGSGAESGRYGGETLAVGAADVVAAPAPSPAGGSAAPRRGPRPAASGGYSVLDAGVKDGGTIRGSVRFGSAPAGYGPGAKAWAVELNKDQDKCGHEQHLTERVVFDAASLGVANCVVYLVGIEEGKDWPEALKAKDRSALLDQKDCKYVPHVMALRSKTQMQIRNSDRAEHNIKGLLNGSTVFNLLQSAGGFIADSGDTYLKRTGTYVLNCDVHPWMSGYVHVFDHPYFVVTGTDGAFEFTDVPAGEWQIVCWHEGMQEVPQYSSTGISGYSYGQDVIEARPVKVAAGSSQDIEFTLPVPTR